MKIVPKTIVSQVEDIARCAGAEIMKHYTTRAIYIKADGSAVTDADHASENIILSALAKLTPDISIISEEHAAAGSVPDISGGTFWVVDPLDGTTEFINKTGAFVVAIALVVDHRVALGVMYHPAKNLMYSGCGPGTCVKTEADGQRHNIAVKKAHQGSLRAVVNEPHADMPRIKGYLSAQFKDAVNIDTESGIFRPCQVAEGLADIGVFCSAKRQGRIRWWDVAPGQAIVEAAGGVFVSFDGQPIKYDAKDLQVAPHAALSALPNKINDQFERPGDGL